MLTGPEATIWPYQPSDQYPSVQGLHPPSPPAHLSCTVSASPASAAAPSATPAHSWPGEGPISPGQCCRNLGEFVQTECLPFQFVLIRPLGAAPPPGAGGEEGSPGIGLVRRRDRPSCRAASVDAAAAPRSAQQCVCCRPVICSARKKSPLYFQLPVLRVR